MNPKDQTKPSRVEELAELYAVNTPIPDSDIYGAIQKAFKFGHSLAQDDLKEALKILQMVDSHYQKLSDEQFAKLPDYVHELDRFLLRMRAGNESAGEGK